MTTAERGVVLLIPGLDGQPDLLAAAAEQVWPGWRVVYFDHRHDRAAGGLDGLADRAAAHLAAAVGADGRAVVCGESFGCLIALALARRHPQRVRGLVLLAGFAWYPWPQRLLARLGLVAWRVLGDPAAGLVLGVGRVLGLLVHLSWNPSRAFVERYLGQPWPDLAAYRAKCRLVLETDERPSLPPLRCPLLVVIGGFDPVVPTSAALEVAALAGGQVAHVPGGHLPHVVAPGRVGRHVADWLAELTESSPGETPERVRLEPERRACGVP
jgi:pimeloyl-ACP methyl ester carboxylesterase